MPNSKGLGPGVKVRLKKETSTLTRYAGWGLRAVTHILKGFVLGYFVLKKEAKEPEEGTYNIRKPNGQYLVMEQSKAESKYTTRELECLASASAGEGHGGQPDSLGRAGQLVGHLDTLLFKPSELRQTQQTASSLGGGVVRV